MASPPQANRVSVVVVTYNGAPWIRRCLSSLRDSVPEPHVVVVDNASADDTAQVVASEFPEVDLLRSDRNLGFGAGNNLGIRHALDRGASFVFLLNQDAYVLPTTLADLAAFLGAHPQFGAATPLHCSPDPEHVDGRTLRGYLQTYAPEYLRDACMARVQPWYKTFGVNAAAWFVRADVFRQVGGFDPLFFMYGEDDDLLHRMAHHNVGFALVPACRAVHLRESPPAPKTGYWGTVRRKSERRRSELLTQVKRPNFSTAHMAAVLIAEGWIAPIAEALETRQLQDYLASVWAFARVAAAFPRIVGHARLTARSGAHFL